MINKSKTEEIPEQVKRDLDAWAKEHGVRPPVQSYNDLSPEWAQRAKQERHDNQLERTRQAHKHLDDKYPELKAKLNDSAPPPSPPSFTQRLPPPAAQVPKLTPGEPEAVEAPSAERGHGRRTAHLNLPFASRSKLTQALATKKSANGWMPKRAIYPRKCAHAGKARRIPTDLSAALTMTTTTGVQSRPHSMT